MELDISDLLTFIDIWYYDKINISLPKIAGNDEAADERRSIRFKKGDKKFEFPIDIQSNRSAKAYSVKLFYDNSKFDIDSVTIGGNSAEASDLSLIYVDSVNGIIYADYAKLNGSVNGNYLLTASVSSNLDKFNPSDSLRMNLTAVNSRSETIFKKSIVYSVTEIPRSYSLSQNYPNPFNPTTTIEYELPEPAKVQLVLYNILGQKVAVMVNNIQKEGAYRYRLDASRINGGLASGVYIYRFVANKFTKTKKLLLLK